MYVKYREHVCKINASFYVTNNIPVLLSIINIIIFVILT